MLSPQRNPTGRLQHSFVWGFKMWVGEQGFKANPVDAEVGYNARTMRSRLGFSQGQIAEQLGLTLAEYQECESGMRRYGSERLLKLARLMDVSPNYFFETLAVRRIEFIS
jgi:hypothetical protein